jgi:prepilin-type N-terminal cleavage/methylation domain-containing protein
MDAHSMTFVRPSPRSPSDARGFTLLELVVAVAIIAVMAGLAANDLSSLMGRYRMNAAARDFSEAVVTSRLAAISGNREFAVHLMAPDTAPDNGQSRNNAGVWEVVEKDRSITPPTWVRVVDGFTDLKIGPNEWNGVSIEPWAPISGPTGQSLPDHLVFSPRGYLMNDPTDFTAGVIRVVFRNKNASFVEQRVVRVDRGGNPQIAAVE